MNASCRLLTTSNSLSGSAFDSRDNSYTGFLNITMIRLRFMVTCHVKMPLDQALDLSFTMCFYRRQAIIGRFTDITVMIHLVLSST